MPNIQLLFPDQREHTLYFKNPTVGEVFPPNKAIKYYIIGYEKIDPDTYLKTLKIDGPVKLGVYIIVTYNQLNYHIYITNTNDKIKTIKDKIKKKANIPLGTHQALKLSGWYDHNYNDEHIIMGSKILKDPSLVVSVYPLTPSPYISKDLAIKATRL